MKIIGRLPFFKHLSPDTISKINDLFHDRDVSADERIYFEGDEAEYLYLVAMGKVKLVRNTDSGREVLLDILRGGEYFGTLTAFGGRVHTETAIAQTDCCILHGTSRNLCREPIAKNGSGGTFAGNGQPNHACVCGV